MLYALLLLNLHPLRSGGDLLFLLSPPVPPAFCFVSALTPKPLLRLFPNISIIHIGPGEFAW